MMHDEVYLDKSSFLIVATYMIVAVFQSANVIAAIVTAVLLFLTQVFMRLLFPLLFRRISLRALPFIATAMTAVIGALMYLLLERVFGVKIQNDSVFFPFPSVIFLAIPMFIAQTQEQADFSMRKISRYFAVFAPFFLAVSAIREILGFGRILGVPVLSSDTGPLPFLTHSSGAALLVLFLMTLIFVAVRNLLKRRFILDTREPFFRHQPVVERQTEMKRVFLMLAALLLTIFPAVLLYAFCFYVYTPEYPYLLVLAVLTIGIGQGCFRLLFSRRKDFLSAYFSVAYILPIQTIILALPGSILFSITTEQTDVMFFTGVLLSYLVLACGVSAFVFLFIRSLRRKALFGNRPDIFRGIPYLLLILSLSLLVLSGFGDVPKTILAGFAG